MTLKHKETMAMVAERDFAELSIREDLEIDRIIEELPEKDSAIIDELYNRVLLLEEMCEWLLFCLDDTVENVKDKEQENGLKKE